MFDLRVYEALGVLFELRPEATTGHIYFVATTGPDELIKIGYTGGSAPHVEVRLRSLQTSSPVPLVCLARHRGTFQQERQLHAIFAADRERGEWFRPSDDLLDLIDSIDDPDVLIETRESWEQELTLHMEAAGAA